MSTEPAPAATVAAPTTRRPRGMAAFVIVWLGQIVSVLATQMTQFALSIWAYQMTGRVTALALMQVFGLTPFLIISPFAGAMVDRGNRKLMMMVSDLGAGSATIALLLLQATGRLELWHLYAAAVVMGTCNSFQWPAYSASVSLMVPKAQYGRANGLMSLIEIGPGVVSPLLAGALLPIIRLTGIMLIDVTTFLIAIGALLVVSIPQPPVTAAGREARQSVVGEAVYGFRYIFQRPSLLGLQLVFFAGNLLSGLGYTALTPFVLAHTGNNSAALGTVMSVGAVGGLCGGLAMSAWGGFRRRVHGVLLGWTLASVLGMVLMGLGRSLPVWAAAAFLGYFFVPIIDGSNQAIWQAKVAPDVQGRVFSARRLIAWLASPITPLIAGPLADFVLEPAMQTGGSLSGTLGGAFGVGPGSGMAVLMTAAGVLAAGVGVAGYLIPAIRDAEDRLPDHDAAPAV
jgi:DHA3 family macrolide efflux protein-like MFS transporter